LYAVVRGCHLPPRKFIYLKFTKSVDSSHHRLWELVAVVITEDAFRDASHGRAIFHLVHVVLVMVVVSAAVLIHRRQSASPKE
jgi:hypothetical protein